ncbi:MAG: DUF1501 domain-containing protein [Planctomycetes bacterium]|nr:DUF1501 domain-containing protein [Planctomycetota bacterium]
MSPEFIDNFSRREMLKSAFFGAGAAAFAELLGVGGAAGGTGVLGSPHFAPRAKRVIYLLQTGGPSQLETFDYKPILNKRRGEPLPDSVRRGQRLTGMSGNQSLLPVVGSPYKFHQYGESRAWVSELLPRTAGVVDELCIIKTMYTEAINHDPAITFFCTGAEQAGRPSMGAWLAYGLGSANANLPAFVVLCTNKAADQPLYARLWGTGFLPSEFQGVQFLAGKDPVLYLNNPGGISRDARRRQLDALDKLQQNQFNKTGDGEILSRMAQAEMAFRMQMSVPEVTDLSAEPEEVFKLYGDDSRKPGTYAYHCLLARRLAERGVRFIQLLHPGWDHHDHLPSGIPGLCRETDQGSAALIIDLKRRGLLDDTLVVWGGEFGRTNYSQGKLTDNDFGRDHHPRCFSIWMAGGGAKRGVSHGETDEYGYNIQDIKNEGVHVHDLHATMLHLLGVDHEKLIYRYQGRDFRLTDVAGKVIKNLVA